MLASVQPFSKSGHGLELDWLRKRNSIQTFPSPSLPSFFQNYLSFAFHSFVLCRLGLSSLAWLGLAWLALACLGSKHNSLTGANQAHKTRCVCVCLVFSCFVLSRLSFYAFFFLFSSLSNRCHPSLFPAPKRAPFPHRPTDFPASYLCTFAWALLSTFVFAFFSLRFFAQPSSSHLSSIFFLHFASLLMQLLSSLLYLSFSIFFPFSLFPSYFFLYFSISILFYFVFCLTSSLLLLSSLCFLLSTESFQHCSLHQRGQHSLLA